MPSPKPPRRPNRWFRALMRLLPAEMRLDHGRDMEIVFGDQHRETAQHEGRSGLLRLWLSTILGTLRTAPAEHWRIFHEDATYALRLFRKNLGFTTIAVLTIGLGIGATTAVFSLVHHVLLRPLPYDDPEQLVHVRPMLGDEESFSGPVFTDLTAELGGDDGPFAGFLTMAGLGSTTLGAELGASGELTATQRVKRLIVSPNYFEVLGARPQLGRLLEASDRLLLPSDVLRATPPEELPLAPVVISHDLWQRRFGGTRDVLGTVVEVGGRPREVVGVLRPDFRVLAPRSMSLDAKRDVWYLSNWDASTFPRNVRFLEVLGRLKPGVQLAEAQAALDAFSARQRERHTASHELGYQVEAVPLHSQVVRGTTRPLGVLAGAVGLVLLIACSNVASLMLAGGATRQGELGVRVAMGASRERLVRQLMTESVLLASMGAALGLAVAFWGLDLMMGFRPDALQRFEEVRLDRPMLVFSLAISFVSAVFFGTVPSLRYSRPRLENALRSGRRSLAGLQLRRGGRVVLVTAEVALSFLLIFATGLLLRSFEALTEIDPGFEPRGVASANLHLSNLHSQTEDTDSNDGQHLMDAYRRLLEQVEAVPGVESAGLTSSIPFDLASGQLPILAEGSTDSVNEIRVRDSWMTPGYFETLGIPLRAGRLPTWGDLTDHDRPFVLVDEALAERLWPGENAVGRRVRLARMVFDRGDGEVPNEHYWAEVLGVVGTVHDDSLRGPPPPTLYSGIHFLPRHAVILAFKTSPGLETPEDLLPSVRAALHKVDPKMAIYLPTTLDALVATSTADLRFTLTLLGVFGAIGLVLAAGGLYALLAHAVRRGVGEIGLRLALGAEPGGILRTVLGQGLRLTTLGLALGVVGSMALERLLGSLLYGVSSRDPLTLAAMATLLLAVAGVACAVPAWRAVRVDPLVALRAD